MTTTTYRKKFAPIPELAHLGPSPKHAKYVALMPEYWKKIDRMEDDLIEHGYPAQGFAQFAKDWFAAWANQDVEGLAKCMTEDCTYIDSSSFQQVKERSLHDCELSFIAFPDFAFYPQDETERSLPYTSYVDGEWRVAIPWRGIGRQSGKVYLPGTDLDFAFEPTGACLDFIGVDRYVIINDAEQNWKIAHIDTDWDIAYLLAQLSPIKLPSVSPRVLRGAAAVERAVMPALRRLGRLGS